VIFSRRNNEKVSITNAWEMVWVEVFGEQTFKKHVLMISGKEYFKYDDNFKDALKSDRVWDRLLYKEKDD